MFGALKKAFKTIKDKIKSDNLEKEEKNIKTAFNVSTKTKIKSFLSEKYILSEDNLNSLIDDLEIKFLQADLSIEVTNMLLLELNHVICLFAYLLVFFLISLIALFRSDLPSR